MFKHQHGKGTRQVIVHTSRNMPLCAGKKRKSSSGMAFLSSLEYTHTRVLTCSQRGATENAVVAFAGPCFMEPVISTAQFHLLTTT